MLPALVSSCQSSVPVHTSLTIAVPVHSSQTSVTVAPHATAVPGLHAQTAPAAQLTLSVPESTDPLSTRVSLDVNQEHQAFAVATTMTLQTQLSSSITTPHIQQCSASGSGASQLATEVFAEVRQWSSLLQKV